MNGLRAAVVALLAGALLLPAGADAKPRKKKSKTRVVSCAQASIDSTTDEFRLVIAVLGQAASGNRAAAAAFRPLAGAKVTATLEGPFVTNGSATGTTDSKGRVSLTMSFGGPGDYELTWTASKPGYKVAKGSETINVTGPMNGACDIT